MAFEKVKDFAADSWSKITDWYYENDDMVWDYASWLVGSIIGSYISSKISMLVGYAGGYSKGYDAGQKNAIDVVSEFSKKA